MNFNWLLFKFDGRINRAKYWLATIGLLCVMITALLALFSFGNAFGHGNGRYVINIIGLSASVKLTGDGMSAASWYPQIVTVPLGLAFGFIYAAVAIKRLHDRNKSGWWLLPFVGTTGLYSYAGNMLDFAEPFVGLTAFGLYVWGFIEMGCLKGTAGTNRFGADPLAAPPSRTAVTPVSYAMEGGPNQLRVAYVIKGNPYGG